MADVAEVETGARRAAADAREPDRPSSSGPTRPAGPSLDALDVAGRSTTSSCCATRTSLDDPARRRADAHHAAPPARHRGARRPDFSIVQRDARPAQPRAGRGHPRRRLHRQRPADQPDDGRRSPRTRAQRRLRRPVRRGGLGDLPAPGAPTTSSRGVEVTFATIVESARRRGEVAIGYRTQAAAGVAGEDGVRINPAKSARLTLGPRDAVIVLAA